MLGIIRAIIAVAVAVSLQMGMTDATEVSPQDAAEECMHGIATMQEETMGRYAGNTWVNFIVNLEGDEEDVARLQEAIFRNFSYSIDAVEERDDLAVAKVTIHQCDFSKVLKKYDKKSYEYITEHLYDEDITDKKKLKAKCLDIYVDQVENVAKAGKTHESTIYLPMTSDGYNGWNVQLDDETMKTIIGDLAIPEQK